MKSPAPHEVDESLFDDTPVPTDFVAEHYDPPQMADRLGVTSDELWLGVRDGTILKPVFLPTAPPLAVWNQDIVEQWLKLGCPMDPAHWAHRALVFCKLTDAVRGSLSAFPPSMTERN